MNHLLKVIRFYKNLKVNDLECSDIYINDFPIVVKPIKTISTDDFIFLYMTIDETVEWMYKLFFRERPIVEEKSEEDYLPTIIYKEQKVTDGTGIYFGILLLVIAEIIYLKKRKEINGFVAEKIRAIKEAKKQTTQEV